MTGSLTHSPAEIIQSLLVQLGIGTLATAGGSWPVYSSQEPDSPDNVITVYNTTGNKDGRSMLDGMVFIHHGIQVQVRAADERSGWTKINSVVVALDEQVLNLGVSVDSSSYAVYSVSRTGTVNSLGEEPESKRRLFTANFLVAVRQIS